MRTFVCIIFIFTLTACGNSTKDDAFVWDADVDNSFEGQMLTVAVWLSNNTTKRLASAAPRKYIDH